jgi:putative transposase
VTGSYHNAITDGARIVTKQRHTASEIAAKLAMADDMAAQGRLHGDIAKSLGVSVMTYHRWRKARGTLARPAPRPVSDVERIDIPNEREHTSQIRELQLENSRLRRLVTDLLLEKVKLEEGLQGNAANRRTIGRN